jgi:glycosyltransferase involved in cell wall biosynthesis
LNPQTSQRQLKISILVSDLSSKGAARWGGAVRPFLLAQALLQLGHEVKMFGVAYDRAAPPIATRIPITAIPCQYHAGFIGSAIALSKLLPKIDGDLLYAVKLKPTSYGIGLLKKLQSRRPLLVDIDDWEMSWFGGDNWQYRPKPKQLAKDLLRADGSLKHPDHPLYLKWMEGLITHADAVTIHTQFIQKRFGGTYIPNGKDTLLFSPDRYDAETSRVKYGLKDFKILMFPGAPRPYKGIEDVLIALDKLDRNDLRLAIVGGSPYDDYDKQLIAKWGRWIIKIPKAPVEAMPEIVAAAHAIVVPQRNTPAALAQFPLKLTDGMAMAKPILATTVGDIPEILSDTGYLVDPDSPKQIAAKIEWIFENLEAANQKGKQARQRCIERYSIEAMAAILAKVLEPFVRGLK